jgi:hypothetical protein
VEISYGGGGEARSIKVSALLLVAHLAQTCGFLAKMIR